MAELEGNSEFEIFKNFYSRNAHLENYKNFLNANCKDDVKSEQLRQSALKQYLANKYYNCLESYTRSLCYATYNGKQYALALGNRSATYFCLKLYQNCINDIDLSLQANYPDDKKSKLYFRKIKCFGEMGRRAEMLREFDNCSTFKAQYSGLSKTQQANLIKEIKSYIMDNVEDVKVGLPLEEISFVVDQEIVEPNTENTCASSAIVFKRGKVNKADVKVLAARDIKRGEVLFVEKAFVGFHHQVHLNDDAGVFYCDLCSKEARNCVPCKTCITVVYCSESCRDTAWKDFHQWECETFRLDYLDRGFFLPLRFVVKAASVGSVNGINKPTTDTPNQFLEIYKFPVSFRLVRRNHKDTLTKACRHAARIVVALKSSKFFDFLMSTPYYKDKNIDNLILFIGGIILKVIIQTFQRSLVVNRLTPIINVLKDNQDMFQLSDMKVKSAAAFCPTISGLPHSCITNTSISFQGNICTVKAFKNINAGDRIYRSVFHITANCQFFDRKLLLDGLALTCKCEACTSIKNLYENFDTLVCRHCGGRAGVEVARGKTAVDCIDCNISSQVLPSTQFKLMELNESTWYKEDDPSSLTLPEALKVLSDWNGILQPYHSLFNKMWKQLSLLYSETANVKKFLEAVKNSKTFYEKRYGPDPFKYVYCLGDICNRCFQFLYNNKGKLPKQEAEEMIIYFANLIEEAKEVVSVEFPYLLNMFITADIYLQQFKTDYLQTEGL